MIHANVKRAKWSAKDIRRLRALYPGAYTAIVAKKLSRPAHSVYRKAAALGLKKNAAFRKRELEIQGSRLRRVGVASRFPKGHAPANKGLRRPGWHAGRMRETQFKKGSVSVRWDPETYHVGALRLNTYGYVDMKFREGPRAWRAFHQILWEDAHGPIPAGHCLCFKDGDPLNIDIESNIELISRRALMLRNSVHNLPAPLKSSIQLLGQLKRRIREKQDRGPAQSLVRDAGIVA